MRNFFSPHIDLFGFSASALCAVHCAIVPVVLTFSSLSTIPFIDHPIIEPVMISASFVLAMISLVPCALKHHRKFYPILIASVGLGLIAGSKLLPDIYEAFLTPLGGLLVALTHFINWKLCNRNKTCLK